MQPWDSTQPPQGSNLASLPVRGNFAAIGDGVLLNATAKAQTIPDLTVLVTAFQYLTAAGVRGSYAGGTSPALVAPSANPRVALLTFTPATTTFAWTYGTEAASPTPPTYPSGVIPLMEVFCRVGMTGITNNDGGIDGYLLRAAPRLLPLAPAAVLVVDLPLLESARFPDGTAGNLFPQPVERTSTGTPVSGVPKLLELVYQFDATAQEFLVLKGRVPALYTDGGTVTLVVDWGMISAITGNIRMSAGLGVVVPGTTDARALITPAPTVSADLAVPGTLGVTTQTRLTLTGLTNVAAGRKFLLSLSLYAGSASNAAGDRVLEAVALEFA